METLRFSIFIEAPVEKVWRTMLEDETYRAWTNEFGEGSHFDGSWDEGSDIRFLGPSQDGGDSGMLSRIKENREYEYLSIEHYGIIESGVEDTTSDQAKEWEGAHENYTFESSDGGTRLTVETDVAESIKGEMEEGWSKALEKLKELCEGE